MDLSPDEEEFPGRLLHQAALWDNVELLEELLTAGCDVDARDPCSRTALHGAAVCERSRCLVALCQAGADVDARSHDAAGGKTALHLSAERGHVENIQVLLRAGASIALPDAAGDCALALSERAAHRHAASLLRGARDALERERLSKHSELRDLVTRWDVEGLKTRLMTLASDAELIVNLTPGGANTLLYIASEAGNTAMVETLLKAGADGRAHPVTKYCPLYIACYRGHIAAATLLLQYFPEAVQQQTVEKWLPLHAACIGGHPGIVTLLLEYKYPEELLSTYTDASTGLQYLAAFDANSMDAGGGTALYVAACLPHAATAKALLEFTVPALTVEEAEPKSLEDARAQVLSPHRSGISLGIHAIVSKLTGQSNAKHVPAANSGKRVRPVCADAAGAGAQDSALGAAARAGDWGLATLLLQHGAKVDAAALPPVEVRSAVESSRKSREEGRRGSRSASAPPRATSLTSLAAAAAAAHGNDQADGPWTPLAIAAYYKNTRLIELFVAHGATDSNSRALKLCVNHGLNDMIPLILATKAFVDTEYKINRALVAESVFASRDADSLTYRALCPSRATNVHWRRLQARLDTIRMSWIVAAAARLNPHVSLGAASLAITRLELADNELTSVPPDLFSLPSLRYLNLSQNKLERLPAPNAALEGGGGRGGRRGGGRAVYTAPLLQDLYLQDNRLSELPSALLQLPALQVLDVSNNKLRALPPQLWGARALQDLNVALNLLRDLPKGEPSSLPQAASDASQKSSGLHFHLGPFSRSTSRSPSIEQSVSEVLEEDEGIVYYKHRTTGNSARMEVKPLHEWRGVTEATDPPQASDSALISLNLSHNQFTSVPAPLACRATSLQRLNMSYNSLRSMSFVTSYPASLRQLDLSHNEITCWPSLPQVETLTSSEPDPLQCFCADSSTPRRPRSGESARAQLLHSVCPRRRHLRLDSLRTLILANNLLTRIQLTTDDDGYASELEQFDGEEDECEWGSTKSSLRSRLLFPQVSMLDVSCNLLRRLPAHIHALANLAVLNISGNKDITDLPAQMGLLSRLWNLSAAGCSLQPPLAALLSRPRARSADVVGYLKSLLQEAKPYTVMKLMIVGVQGIGKTSLLECLRQESGITHRRKTTDHWTKRMGNSAKVRGNLSTVGVDIGTWVYEKPRSARPPVTFRTWDFAGQNEYYATHQYFLSKRSLYLVVWKATDGRKGLAGALEWLRSIQTRAPGSPVIMVATHYDQVANSNLPESECPEALQRLISTRIMGAPDADKLGLPKVMDTVEVSCSTRHNIRLLADIIYTVAFSVKAPGSKEPMLEQRIPASYLALEECVNHLANELKDAVLTREQYKRMVTQYMQQKNYRSFRDSAEFHQATMFLHENGVLLHYEDASLKELYFLRPQWLCDVLAHVVTVKQINPFVVNGILQTEALAHVFKSSPALRREPHDVVALLCKFSLAVALDARSLLLPALLPAQPPAQPQVAQRGRPWLSGRGLPAPRRLCGLTAATAERTDSPTLIQESAPALVVTPRASSAALRRLLALCYAPRGLSARLCARLLHDAAAPLLERPPYAPPAQLDHDESLARALDMQWGWRLWQTGLSLVSDNITLLTIRELPSQNDQLLGPSDTPIDHPYYNHKFRILSEGSWLDVDVCQSACLEVFLPGEVCVVRREDGEPIAGCQSISIEPNPEVLAKILATVCDHIDLLLEDWYPSLGTRFVHTSEGKCLITRLIPCPACLRDPPPLQQNPHHQMQEALRGLELAEGGARLSADSRASDGDSGVGADSNGSSRIGSREGAWPAGPGPRLVLGWAVEHCMRGPTHCSSRMGSREGAWPVGPGPRLVLGWAVEHCMRGPTHCPTHGPQDNVAPDLHLQDLPPHMLARWEDIKLGPPLGRGAFGAVRAATWGQRPVAIKLLEAPPGPGDKAGAGGASGAGVGAGAACRAYCALRQELGVLAALAHAHVLPLQAACARPRALLLQRAPMVSEGAACPAYCALRQELGVLAALAHAHVLPLQAACARPRALLLQRAPMVSEGAACPAYCALRQELGVLAALAHAHVLPLQAACARPRALLLQRAPMVSEGAACPAYCALRQELGVLAALAHAHVLPLQAACARPRALLLQRAPMGALDASLREARRAGARLGPRVLRLLALQVARALEYIHAKRIVYRDLKSENILVWSMPRPQDLVTAEQSETSIDVHIKLGDYGISRFALPSGIKGFGGTEGYMAPEIMKYNGEEEYNEKVDCFSYGMLLYELVTLKQPFEGHEAVKEAILEGARPSLTPRDLCVPVCILEAMRRCWWVRAEGRPSAAALQDIAAAAEFTTLQGGTITRQTDHACAVPVYMAEEEEGGWEVWCSQKDRLSALLLTSNRVLYQHTITLPPDIDDGTTQVTSLLTVGTTVWVGDSTARITVYKASTHSVVWQARLTDSVGGLQSPVAAMAALPSLARVAVALHCGRLFIVRSDAAGGVEENSFVLTELGTAPHLCALTALPTDDGYSVWAGGNSGLSVYAVTSCGVMLARHVTDAPVGCLAAASHAVIAYHPPGSVVSQWHASTLEQGSRLDCSKLVPCSETLQSIAIDERVPEDLCKVTSLCVCVDTLYVCSAWGCVIVAEGDTLRPVAVCRPSDGPISVILPLLPHKYTEWYPMFVTFGKGYRPLVERFVTQSSTLPEETLHDYYCLLWRSGRWLPD